MTALAMPVRRSPFAVFRRRSFTLLWNAQLVSSMGWALSSLASSILVYRATGSAFSVGLLMMMTVLPSLLFGLIAGVFVDRWDRKRIMIAADVCRALLMVLIPSLLPLGLIWLYIIQLLSNTINQFFLPAQSSILPETASDDELAAANALMQISSVGSTAVGFIAAGVITSQSSISVAFYLNALAYLVSALCTSGISVAQPQATDSSSVGTVFHNLHAGISYLRTSSVLRSLLLSCIFAFLGYAIFNTVLLPFTVRVLDGSEVEYGLLEGLQSGGFVVGALLVARVSNWLKDEQWVALSYVLTGVSVFACALAPSMATAIMINIAIGLVNAPNYIGRSLVIQRNTTREMRGRVNSAFLVANNIMYVVGMALSGMADLFDVRWFIITSSLLIVVTGMLILVVPALRQPVMNWRRANSPHDVANAPRLGLGRAPTLQDLEQLVRHLPVLAGLDAHDRQKIAKAARIYKVPAGTAILRHGEHCDAAYFILDGRMSAGREEAGAYRVLEMLNAGSLFGEIAALSGVPRTATVVAEEMTTVLLIPAMELRRIMRHPAINRLVLSQMTARLLSMSIVDVPRFASLNQTSLRELRTPTA